ncbi:MAG: M15 family metallopeptidase [Bradyrhizobium sp.]|nr:M15 family metallopeptidase [Bradyrhizobium sp.]
MNNVWPLQSDCVAFYGDPSQANWLQANTIDIPCPWPLFMGNDPIAHILIHKKCADSLTRVLNNVWDAVGHSIDAIKKLRYDQYDGSYNFRPIRGGGIRSMHAFAVAIDWDAADNQFHSSRHLFTDDSLIVVKFKEEGWIWGGDWSPGSVDAMHVQAARVHP